MLPDFIQTIQVNSDQAQFLIHLTADNPCFAGHFDEYPILPGIIQIHWANLASQKAFNCLVHGDINQLKFMAPIQPPIEIILSIQNLAQKNCISFNYTNSAGKIFSSGKMSTAVST